MEEELDLWANAPELIIDDLDKEAKKVVPDGNYVACNIYIY